LTQPTQRQTMVVAIALAAVLDFTANYLAQFFVHIGPLMDDAGTLTFAFSFVVYDYIRRQYGRRATVAAILLGATASLVFALIPGNGGVGQITFASLGALACSGTTDFVMQTLTLRWPIWRYVLVCNAVSLAVDTFVFSHFAYAPPLVGTALVQLMAGQYLNKMLVSVAAIPLVYGARAWAARYTRTLAA